MPLGTKVGLSPGDSVLDGDPAPSPQTGWSPSQIFGPFLLWPNDWMHQDATWCGGRSEPRGLCVRWGPSPLTKKRVEPPPQFSAHVCCGQTDAWIKMPLGTEVGIGPDDVVLDGDPALPPQKGGRAPSPIFGPCLLWPNCSMDQGGTWHGDGPWSRPHCARWGHSSPPPKRDRAPQFWPMSIVAKRLDGLRRHLVQK